MNSLGIYMESELEPETHVDGGPQEPKNSASEGDEDDDENLGITLTLLWLSYIRQ